MLSRTETIESAKSNQQPETRYFGVSLGDWIKFGLFFVGFYVSVRVTQIQVEELKAAFSDTKATIEQIRTDVNQLKLTNAVLVDQYNNEKQRRIEELERQLAERRK